MATGSVQGLSSGSDASSDSSILRNLRISAASVGQLGRRDSKLDLHVHRERRPEVLSQVGPPERGPPIVNDWPGRFGRTCGVLARGHNTCLIGIQNPRRHVLAVYLSNEISILQNGGYRSGPGHRPRALWLPRGKSDVTMEAVRLHPISDFDRSDDSRKKLVRAHNRSPHAAAISPCIWWSIALARRRPGSERIFLRDGPPSRMPTPRRKLPLRLTSDAAMPTVFAISGGPASAFSRPYARMIRANSSYEDVGSRKPSSANVSLPMPWSCLGYARQSAMTRSSR